jgi:hypothetical protein
MHQLVAMYAQDTHRAPMVPFTIQQAHHVMQRHATCRAKDCPRKAAAFQVLIDAGRMKPDASRPR